MSMRDRLLLSLVVAASSSPIAVNGRAGEVIGASGRIGSLLLRAGAGELAAVPRGVAPGSLSPRGQPIIVATPASALASVLKATPPERVEDLVLLCNGLAEQKAAEVVGAEAASRITAGCLFFGVLGPGAEARHGEGAPPTTLAGKHAETVAALIRSMGPRCEVVGDMDALESVSQLKLLWSSALWLLCNTRSVTVEKAHEEEVGVELRALVTELVRECTPRLRDDVDGVLEQLAAYSCSMPGVVPSAALAKGEVVERNGVFVHAAAMAGREQPVHTALLAAVGVDVEELLEGMREVNEEEEEEVEVFEHTPSGMRFYRRRRGRAKKEVASAIVVGGGMMGSAIAAELSRRGVRTTVVEQRERPAEEEVEAEEGGEVVCVDATSGSWAWLNANGKDAMSSAYAALNRVGMAMWRRHEVYCALPVWSGTIVVAAAGAEGEGAGGAYAVEADVGGDAARDLEPLLGRMDGSLHHYPDEGHVDPAGAVAAARRAAEAAGATFVWGVEVEALVHGNGGAATGVRVGGEVMEADVVVLAAGVGIGGAALGAAVPMEVSPGRLAYTAASDDSGGRMCALVVDTMSGSHCLQREDGSFVVGGDLSGSPLGEDGDGGGGGDGALLLQKAAALLPVVGEQRLQKTTVAGRVLPRDGFPAVGWSVRSGAYVCCAHSGMTLAPLLSALAVEEIVEGFEMELIDEAWRVHRFE